MKDYYSEIASGYDELHGAEQDEKLREFLAKLDLRPNITLLDVGCGTGRSAKFFDDVHWHGIEPSPGLIEHAPKAVRAKMILGSAENLPWPDASFDVVLSLTAMQNFTHPQQGVQEMYRVAKPNALLLISFLKKSPKQEMLCQLLRTTFVVIEEWEQRKDRMFLCKR